MCNEYNGYSNYQTWNVALWLDNNEVSYYVVREMADGLEKTSQLADWIKDFVEEQNPVADQASMFTDLMGHALANVDWIEIAEAVLAE